MPKVKEGWALIKVTNAGICGTDLNIYAGGHPRAKAPLIPGHEFSGVLMQDAGSLKKGQRVTAYPLLSCGHCEPCQTGNAHVCDTLGLLGIDCDGGMAEYTAAPIDCIIPIGDDVTNAVGAFIEPIAVTVHALRENHFMPGDNVVLFGCGTIGMATALTLRHFGASSVVIFETDEARAAMAKKLGFAVYNPMGMDMAKEAKRLTGAGGFDWVFDCAGVQPVADMLFDAVKVRGHIVIIAAYKKPASLPLIMGMFKETSIGFTRVYRKKDFEIAAELAAKMPEYAQIITHQLPIQEAQKGFDLLTTKGTGAVKVMYKL